MDGLLQSSAAFLRRLWRDTNGATSVVDMVLASAIVGLGVLAGLSTFRDRIVFEFGDAATALRRLDQSYSVVIGGNVASYHDTEANTFTTSMAVISNPGSG